jgi:Putative adhesin
VQTTSRGNFLRVSGTRALVVLAGVLCVCLPSFANIDQVFRETYKLPAGGQFQLDNVNGSVHVEGWDRDEVEVQAVKTSQNDAHDLDQVKIEVESHPGEVDVHTRYPTGQGADVAVEYHIRVPNRVLLACVQTVNGSLEVHGVDGGGQLRSVNGNVEVTDSSGRFNAKTTNGDLHLELRHLIGGAPMNLETVNGSVVLGLPSNASADLDVHNMNGDLYSDFPVTSTTALPGSRAFHSRLGHGGGGAISVRTINGGIRLVREQPL